MEETWASGAIELLKHADSHIQLETAFDSRIAFISIDNSVETSIRTFLSLPEKISGVKFNGTTLSGWSQGYTACLLGTVKRGYAFGRRFTARGSLRPDRFPTRCPATAFKRALYNPGIFFWAAKVILSLNASRVCTVPLKLIFLGKIPNKEAD